MNSPNEAVAEDSTTSTTIQSQQPSPSSSSSRKYQETKGSIAIPRTEPDIQELEDPDFDAVSMYTVRRSRPYDLESLTSTRSLYEKELDYTVENGRRYGGQYFAPNDEAEQDRLHITHQTYLSLFNNELTSVSLDNPSRILDIGTGTGDWAIAMGEKYPSAEVIGTDLSAIQPTAIPANVYFEIDDAEDETGWTFPNSSFDLVHIRNLSGSFTSWPTIYKSSLETLRPGGWIEVIDFDDWTAPAFSSYFSPTSPLHNYLRTILDCCEKIGRPRSQAHLSVQVLSDVGFVDCEIRKWEAPIGPWRKDEEGKSVGKLWLLGILEGFEALGLRLLTHEANWTVQEVKDVCEKLRTELLDIVKSGRGVGLAAGVKVLTGRKPVALPSDEGKSKMEEDG